MKNLYKVIFLIMVIFSTFYQSGAQTPKPTVTPTETEDYDVSDYESPLPSGSKFSVKLPMGNVYAGETINVRVESSASLTTGDGSLMYPIRWEITGGTITDGKDTPEIKVKVDENSSNLSARVEIVNFFGVDSAFASGKIEILKKPKAALFAELKYKSSKDDRNVTKKFNEFFEDLKKQSANEGHIIIRVKKKKNADNIEKLITRYASEKNLDLSNITIKHISDERNSIRFYTVPSDAEIPSW